MEAFAQQSTVDDKSMVYSRLCEAVIRFEKETTGRGPEEVRAYFLDDVVLLREKGILTKAEMSLFDKGDKAVVKELIYDFRRQLLDAHRETLERSVEEIMGREIISMYADIDAERRERVIVLTF